MADTTDLPEYVSVCWACEGKGERRQTYTAGCGMGTFSMMGTCDWCDGMGYQYKATGKPVPRSVVNQIKVARHDR